MSLRPWSADVVSIGDRIAALTAVEAAELIRYLEQIHGVQAEGLVRALPDPEPTVVVNQCLAEPAAFDVVLEGFDPSRKIQVIKAARELTGAGLKEAVSLFASLPLVFKQNLSRAEAEELRSRLAAAGAEVSLRPAL